MPCRDQLVNLQGLRSTCDCFPIVSTRAVKGNRRWIGHKPQNNNASEHYCTTSLDITRQHWTSFHWTPSSDYMSEHHQTTLLNNMTKSMNFRKWVGRINHWGKGDDENDIDRAKGRGGREEQRQRDRDRQRQRQTETDTQTDDRDRLDRTTLVFNGEQETQNISKEKFMYD